MWKLNCYECVYAQGVELQLRRLEGLVQAIRENINYIKDRYVSFALLRLSVISWSLGIKLAIDWDMNIVIKSLFRIQGSRDAGSEWNNQLKSGLVQYNVTRGLRCGCGNTNIVPEAVFPQEETHLKLGMKDTYYIVVTSHIPTMKRGIRDQVCRVNWFKSTNTFFHLYFCET